MKVAARPGFSLSFAPGMVDRVDACLSGAGYTPHRHDTYAIGITLAGIQQFDYRGATRHALPGDLIVLHPDELHDGRAGDARSLRYRTAYVAPASVQAVLDGRSLPFVEGGISRDPRLRRAIFALLADFDQPLSELEHQDALYDLASALHNSAGNARPMPIVNHEAARRARDYIEAHLDRGFGLAEVEQAVGHNRWQLSRDFRAIFGTSPYRYLILRRLDRARVAMRDGRGNAEAALLAGFADQSHFNRQFKRVFGLTPGQWRCAITPHDRSRPAASAASRSGCG